MTEPSKRSEQTQTSWQRRKRHNLITTKHTTLCNQIQDSFASIHTKLGNWPRYWRSDILTHRNPSQQAYLYLSTLFVCAVSRLSLQLFCYLSPKIVLIRSLYVKLLHSSSSNATDFYDRPILLTDSPIFSRNRHLDESNLHKNKGFQQTDTRSTRLLLTVRDENQTDPYFSIVASFSFSFCCEFDFQVVVTEIQSLKYWEWRCRTPELHL